MGGLFNEYALVSIRDDYLRLETQGFNADGSEIGVLDSFEIGNDPGPDSDQDGMRDPWELANGLDPNDPTGVNGPDGDLDGDGQTNFVEWMAGTVANDRHSRFELLTARLDDEALHIAWPSAPGRRYRIHTSEDLKTWMTYIGVFGRPVEIKASDGELTTFKLRGARVKVRYVKVSAE